MKAFSQGNGVFLGVEKSHPCGTPLKRANYALSGTLGDDVLNYTDPGTTDPTHEPVVDNHLPLERGKRRYELANHLGNVLATISDRKLGVDDPNQGTGSGSSHYAYIDYYLADVASAQDYYAFGMQMPGRGYTNTAFVDSGYRFGFQGQEGDDEIAGVGNCYTAMFWQYDPRLGRRWNIDPVYRQVSSSYIVFGNNPVTNVDPEGDDWYDINDEIVWRDHEGKLNENGCEYTSLGKNVIVGYHNRDENHAEELNTALFVLYLETNKEGPSAYIYGNTVPADQNESGTMAEGIYPARFQPRASYVRRGEEDLAILISEGHDVPSVLPNNNRNGIYFVGQLFLHKGNPYAESLFDRSGNAYSQGCQTTGCGPDALEKHNEFMRIAGNFNGTYYLRSRPKLELINFDYKSKRGINLRLNFYKTVANRYAKWYNEEKSNPRLLKYYKDRSNYYKEKYFETIFNDLENQ